MATAEADAIKRIADALPQGQVAMYMLGLKYLEALPAVTQGKGTTIFLPAEASGVMGALGGMRELLKATAGQGGAVGGQTPYTPATQRPAFKSIADGTSGSNIAGSSPSGSSDNS
jgi:hypothetical protein